jgi:hypothetical protein
MTHEIQMSVSIMLLIYIWSVAAFMPQWKSWIVVRHFMLYSHCFALLLYSPQTAALHLQLNSILSPTCYQCTANFFCIHSSWTNMGEKAKFKCHIFKAVESTDFVIQNGKILHWLDNDVIPVLKEVVSRLNTNHNIPNSQENNN